VSGGSAVPAKRRLAVVVMGVSGSGKSTAASAIGAALGLHFIDGDSLHSSASVAKMQAGTPLQDADRWPWLDRIGAALADAAQWPQGVVIACSALRRSYRDRIRAAAPGVRFVFLDGSRDLIGSRMAGRRGHYMPGSLLDSQFRTLEVPGEDETDVRRMPIDHPVSEIVRRAVHELAQD
jgi:gluconokinase